MVKIEEIYVSTDIETDGPIPGPHSMLSLGSAAYTADKRLISEFEINFHTLEGAKADPETMESFWSKHPEAWEAATRDREVVSVAMRKYDKWVRSLPGTPIFVGYPVTFDFAFVHWYFIKFMGRDPFGFAGLDIKSYAMAVMGKSFTQTAKRNMPKHWFDPIQHTHIALDDAKAQGTLFCNILAQDKRRRAQTGLYSKHSA